MKDILILWNELRRKIKRSREEGQKDRWVCFFDRIAREGSLRNKH